MADSKKKVFSKHFTLGLVIYSIVLLAIIAVGLTFFWSFIRAYEESRPVTAVKQYMAGLNRDYLQEHVRDFFTSLDQGVQSKDESLDRIFQIVANADYARRPDDSNDSLSYVLRSEGTVFDSITLIAENEGPFGFPLWQVTREEFDFDAFCSETELTVPSEWSVSLGGRTLGSDYIADAHVQYALLNEFYDDGLNLPYMVTYRTGRYVGELPVQVLDQNNQAVSLDEVNEDTFTDNCTAAVKADIESFSRDYVNRYVSYMGSHEAGLIYANYANLKALVQPGSTLDSRLSQVMGLGYSRSIDSLENVEFHDIMDIGDGYYVCSLTYYVNTKGNRDYVLTTNNAKLLLISTGYGLRAAAQISY